MQLNFRNVMLRCGFASSREARQPPCDARIKDLFRRDPFEILRAKWNEVPAGDTRLSTSELSRLPDDQLLDRWRAIRNSATTGPSFSVRGWYHTLYKDIFRGKRVLDVGSGLGIDGITFAEAGAQMTFVDIVASNLEIISRLCRSLNINHVQFLYLDDLSSLEKLENHYDVIWCQGSMINAPFETMRAESAALLDHLPIGGRWIELAYPKIRWEREGRQPFSKWGESTDGPGTPWVEWYDLSKLLARLRPAQFDTVLHFNFHDNDFNWFDLVRSR